MFELFRLGKLAFGATSVSVLVFMLLLKKPSDAKLNFMYYSIKNSETKANREKNNFSYECDCVSEQNGKFVYLHKFVYLQLGEW